MGVTTRDIFGEGASAVPATDGSYGEPSKGQRLPRETRLGQVKLQVADLARSIEFYEDVLGLRIIAGDGSTAVLAAHGDHAPVVELREVEGTRSTPVRSRLGLFHFAILVPDRASLGRFAKHLAEVDVRAGASDHLVSEAFYLQDPDNLGIEVYADRPRSAWMRVGRELMMATDPLDVAGLLDAADGPWMGMPAGTRIGHVHLHVGDLATASSFFSDAIGFDRMVWHYPGALFLAAGGYHHHLGTNTWAGRGASPPSPDEARLLEWTIELPDQASRSVVAENLNRAGHEARWLDVSSGGKDLIASDPWGTGIRFIVRSTI